MQGVKSILLQMIGVPLLHPPHDHMVMESRKRGFLFTKLVEDISF